MITILGGERKGYKLYVPDGINLRPVTNRIKKSLFDSIAPYIKEKNIWDVFAGTGILGIESLSRGAKFACFSEIHPSCIEIIIRNIQKTDYVHKSLVLQKDAFSLPAFFKNSSHSFNIIYLFPPYIYYHERSLQLKLLLKNIVKFNILSNNGIMVAEYMAKQNVPRLLSLKPYRMKKYGQIELVLVKKEGIEC